MEEITLDYNSPSIKAAREAWAKAVAAYPNIAAYQRHLGEAFREAYKEAFEYAIEQRKKDYEDLRLLAQTSFISYPTLKYWYDMLDPPNKTIAVVENLIKASLNQYPVMDIIKMIKNV